MLRLTLALVLASAIARADVVPDAVRAHAMRRTGDVTIDGRLDEGAWTVATKQGGFIQRFPKDGAKASQETEFAFLYDDEAIYVGVWAHDSEPQLIRRLLTRRDVDASSASTRITIAVPPTCSSSMPPACSATCSCSTT
jgi:hypothetical protein